MNEVIVGICGTPVDGVAVVAFADICLAASGSHGDAFIRGQARNTACPCGGVECSGERSAVVGLGGGWGGDEKFSLLHRQRTIYRGYIGEEGGLVLTISILDYVTVHYVCAGADICLAATRGGFYVESVGQTSGDDSVVGQCRAVVFFASALCGQRYRLGVYGDGERA